jgi:hypothetical protein
MLRTTSLACQAARNLPTGVAGLQQAEQLGASLLGEALVGSGEQTPAPVQRVVLVAPVAEGLVLRPALAFVELGAAPGMATPRSFPKRR